MNEDKDKEVLIEKVREFERRTGKTADSWPDDPNNTASVLKEHRYLSEPVSPAEAERDMFARSRRGFLVGGVAALVGIFGWKWMGDETKAALFRRTFAFNESVSKFFYSTRRLAAEFPPERITRPERFNGAEGLAEEITAADWRLQVKGLPGSTADLTLTIDDVKRLPRTEMITEFKCIEGWSTIVHWAGVRFSDFIAAYSPTITPRDLPKYVLLLTPDEKYFVGWDIESILHPQTLLAYEMNEAPLRHEHGAPLRLASTAKYGIKQIKRVGTIEFTNERPRDFWSQPVFGYDWYSGH